MDTTSYAIALGSNRRHGRHGDPARVIAAALAALRAAGIEVTATAPVFTTDPVGPSSRRYANSAALVRTPLAPLALLALLKGIERDFGRRRGQRWGSRVIDLDILLWSGGRWRDRRLTIPHVGLPHRRFVLDPLVTIAPGWRDPATARSIAQLAFRAAAGLRQRSPVDRAPRHP